MIAPARDSETRAAWGQGTEARTLRFKLRRVGWSERRHGEAVVLLLHDSLGRLPTVSSQQVALQIAFDGVGHDSAAAAKRLGSLTDAFVVVRPDAVIAVRGGASSTRLFLRRLGQDWLMTDTLDDIDAGQLRSDWLAFFLANSVQGPFEPRATLDTVFNSVHRVPPASVVELRADRLTRHEILHDYLSGLPNDTEELRHALADTIVATLTSAVDAIPPGMAVAYELSGGLDSTSVALASQAAAKRAGRQRAANSIVYPYFEFRRERYFIDAAARVLGLTSHTLDGSELLPFDHWSDMPPHDEPSLAAVGFAQHRAMLAAAAARGAGISFHGFGGDTIFGMGPARQFSGFGTQLRPDWLGKRGWSAVTDHLQTLRAWFGDGESGFHRQYFSGAHIDDGWADVVLVPRLGCPRAGGFTHPDVLRLTATLWPRQPPGAAYKQILRDLFAAQLPAELLSRPHKIAYDGLYVRGYRRHRTGLEQLIARHAETLACAGVELQLLLAALDKVCSGHLEGDQPLGTVLAALVWMDTRT